MSQSSPIWNASLTVPSNIEEANEASQSSPIWNASLTLNKKNYEESQSSPIWNASLTFVGAEMMIDFVAVLTYMECFSDCIAVSFKPPY